MNEKELMEFARALALALADEVAFAGDDAAELSLELLARARKELSLETEFEKIDTLKGLNWK